MTRQPERLADLFPGVLAELAARHIPQQRTADLTQPSDADAEWSLAAAAEEGRAR